MPSFQFARNACVGALLLAAATWAAPSLAAAARASAVAAQSYTFAFQDADVGRVAEEILGQTLGLTYTIDPAITGKITFRIDRRLTKEQLLEAFEAVLANSDIALVRQGDSLALTPRAKAKGAATLRTLDQGIHHAGYGTLAVPLSYATPSEVAKALGSISANDVVVYTDDKAGLLVLGGTGQELEAAVEMIHVFDHSALDDAKIRWFELTRASATTVSEELQRVLQATGAQSVTVVPLKRLNGIFVFARTAKSLDDVAGWVAKLDVPSKEPSTTLFVYHPRNGAADGLAHTLQSVLSGQSRVDQTLLPTTSPAGSPPSSEPPLASQSMSITASDEDPVRIGSDKDTNTLIISTSPSRWIQIQRILDEIDRTPNQILIEASILEVTLGDEFHFGVDWSLLSPSGKLNVSSVQNQTGIVGPTFPGFSLTFLDSDIQAAVAALGSKTAVEVISAPKIVALENRTAHLQIGDQVPIVVQSGQSTSAPGSPVINTVDYRNTGVILNVTPRITGENKIFLDIAQEVSSVAQTKTSGIDSPTIQQRKLESALILNDGGVVALGGLISSSRTRGDSGVPWLKDIPVVGNLFKHDDRNGRRTELIVLITATIIRDQPTADRVMAKLLADMREIEARGLLKP